MDNDHLVLSALEPEVISNRVEESGASVSEEEKL
jgi:regulator of extracellular matrix RemA (YlzA/DUF370 family)